MKTHRILKILLMMAWSLMIFACVHDPGISPSLDPHVERMMEMHQKMAAAHTQMAQCLASGKRHQQCHEALVAECAKISMPGRHSSPAAGKSGRGPGGGGMMWNCPMLLDEGIEANPPQ